MTARGSNGTAAACPAAKVADEALPSVVTVRASNAQQGSSGSGVVIQSGGYILTNNHVISVAAGGGPLSIVRSDGETTDATIVGRDPLTDLAVIKAQDDSIFRRSRRASRTRSASDSRSSLSVLRWD